MPGNQNNQQQGQNGQQNGQNGAQQKPTLSWSTPVTSTKPAAVAPAAPQKQTTAAPAPKPAAKNTPASTKKSGRTIAWIGGAVVVIALAAWGLVALHNKNAAQTPAGMATSQTTDTGSTASTDTTGTGGSMGTQISAGALSLTIPSPQAAGLQVAVQNISVSVPTWVVVYENHNGQPGNALGAAWFAPSVHSGTVDLLRGTLPGQTYLVGEARDDGDKIFSLQNDPAVRDEQGNPMLVQFQTK